MSYESSKEERHAYDIGRRHGRNAADWAIQDLWGGRATRGEKENAQRILKGIEEGDPEVMDAFKLPDLSGEWADGMTPQSLYEAIGVSEEEADGDDSYSEQYEQGVSDGFWGRLESSAKSFLESNENPLTHGEAKKLLDYAHADYMDSYASKPGSTRRAYSKGRAHASVTAVGVSNAPAIETKEAMLLRGKINSIPNPHWSSPEQIPLTELEMWVNNDEGLYNMWKRSRESIRNFIKNNRKEISEGVYNAINRPPRGNPLALQGNKFKPYCGNCGQWQYRSKDKKYLDCSNECARRGFEYKRTMKELEKRELGNPPKRSEKKYKIEVRKYKGGTTHYSMKPIYDVIEVIERKIWAEQIGNFNPIFAEYKGKRTLIHSDSGDLSDPFRREEGYSENLFIELKSEDMPLAKKLKMLDNPSNRTLAQAFASGATSGKGFGNVFIEGNTIYSYGHHWPIATRHASEKIAYINAGHYSPTTSKHTGAIAGALAISGYTTIPSDRTDSTGVLPPSSEFVESRKRGEEAERVRVEKRVKGKSEKLRKMAGVSKGAWPNGKKTHKVSSCPGCGSVKAREDDYGELFCANKKCERHRGHKPSAISKQQSFLAGEYDKHLQKELDKKRRENPPMKLIGRKCLEIKMSGGLCEGNFGAAYGMADGSAFIKGVFTKVPGGRVKTILYLDEAKAKREGLSPAGRPWKHDFSSLDAKAVRVKGGLVIKSKTPLWENR